MRVSSSSTRRAAPRSSTAPRPSLQSRGPFRSSHPYGCSDHGSSVVVRREVLLDVMKHYDPAAQERPEALFRILWDGTCRRPSCVTG